MKTTNPLIYLLIFLLGLSLSCKNQDPVVEYDTTKASLIIKGIIESSADKKLIPDIIVEMRKIKSDTTGQSESILKDADFSNVDGYYRLSDLYNSVDTLTYQIKFTDTDGTLNGQYETLDTMIVFKNLKFIGSAGHWSLASVEKVVNVKLKPRLMSVD